MDMYCSRQGVRAELTASRIDSFPSDHFNQLRNSLRLVANFPRFDALEVNADLRRGMSLGELDQVAHTTRVPDSLPVASGAVRDTLEDVDSANGIEGIYTSVFDEAPTDDAGGVLGVVAEGEDEMGAVR
jgi:hypothetical protein